MSSPHCYTFLGRTKKEIFLATHCPFIHSYPHLSTSTSPKPLPWPHLENQVSASAASTASVMNRSHRLCDEPVSPLQLVTHVIYDEDVVPNVKCMRIVEEEVSPSQPKTVVVPQGPSIAVPQGPSIAVPPEEEVPLKEEEFLAPTVGVSQGPPIAVPPEEEEVPVAPLVAVLPEGRGCLVPVPTLVSSPPFFFFLKNAGVSSRPFFS
jgi:hypothetical protein